MNQQKRLRALWIDAPQWNTKDSLSLPIFNKYILSQMIQKINWQIDLGRLTS